MTDTTSGTDDSAAETDEFADGYMTAIHLVLSVIRQDNRRFSVTSPVVVEGLCLLVIEGLRQLGAAESLLDEDQQDPLHSGVVPAPDPEGFPLAALEDLLGRLMLQQAGLDDNGSGS
jgi:hypothetical protein